MASAAARCSANRLLISSAVTGIAPADIAGLLGGSRSLWSISGSSPSADEILLLNDWVESCCFCWWRFCTAFGIADSFTSFGDAASRNFAAAAAASFSAQVGVIGDTDRADEEEDED